MHRAALLLIAVLVSTSAFANAKITIHNTDPASKGFNDSTPVAPVGGNPGTTLGQQRLNAFQNAAGIWSGILNSDVEIVIDGTFTDLPCDASTAVLGFANAAQFVQNFPNAPRPNVIYPLALANAIAHKDLRLGGSPDIEASFNAKLDTGTCLGGATFYYGFDGNHGTNIDVVPMLLHEFAHGLGFVGTESLTTGDLLANAPSVFALHVLDDVTGLHWDQMTPAQRLASVTHTANLVWDGASTRDAAAKLLAPLVTLHVDSPAAIAGDFEIGRASFGGDPSILSGTLAAPQQIARPRRVTSEACTPFANAAELAGKIALVDRGTCTFAIKAHTVEAAGAIGMIVVDNAVSTCIPPSMSSTDTSIHIPVVSVTHADGEMLKAQIARGVGLSMRVDPSRRTGADRSGYVRLYAPCAFKGGSSVFHWDVAATPNLLMEPNISSDLSHGVDLTANQLMDIGWTTNAQ